MGDAMELVTVKREDLEELALRAMFGDATHEPMDIAEIAADQEWAEARRRVQAMIMENLGGWVQISE